MNLEHSFTVPVGVDEAWRILLDINRIGPCMPGAAIESVDGDDFTGSVKVKLGPIGLTYKGKASFVEKDEAAHRAVIDARGRDARGNGTASAKVTATLTEQGGNTLVEVATDLDITGKPAQFGRGVMVDVGNKLIGQFADNLAATIGSDAGSEAPSQTDSGGDAAPVKEPAAKAPAKAPAARNSAAKTSAAKAAPRKRAAKATKSTADTGADAGVADAGAAASGGEAAGSAGAPISESAVEASAQEPASYAAPSTSNAASAAPVNGKAASSAHTPSRPAAPPQREVEPINLLESAGPAVAKRLVPLIVALLVAILVVRRLRR